MGVRFFFGAVLVLAVLLGSSADSASLECRNLFVGADQEPLPNRYELTPVRVSPRLSVKTGNFDITIHLVNSRSVTQVRSGNHGSVPKSYA